MDFKVILGVVIVVIALVGGGIFLLGGDDAEEKDNDSPDTPDNPDTPGDSGDGTTPSEPNPDTPGDGGDSPSTPPAETSYWEEYSEYTAGVPEPEFDTGEPIEFTTMDEPTLRFITDCSVEEFETYLSTLNASGFNFMTYGGGYYSESSENSSGKTVEIIYSPEEIRITMYKN